MTPRHRALANRLVLAELCDDHNARDITADDIGQCPHCWQQVAYDLAFAVAALKIELRFADGGLDHAIAFTQRDIALHLDNTTMEGPT